MNIDGKTLVVDNDLRKITIPDDVKYLGVEHDENVHCLQFAMPVKYGNTDLSTFGISINFMNAGNEGDRYPVADATVDGEYLYFSWLVGRNATRYKGTVNFIVCLREFDSEGEILREFNTAIAKLNVLEGLETTEVIVEQNPDIIEHMLKLLDKIAETGGGTFSVSTERFENDDEYPGRTGVKINVTSIDVDTGESTMYSTYLFDGEKGDKGDKGEKGDTGPQGVQGICSTISAEYFEDGDYLPGRTGVKITTQTTDPSTGAGSFGTAYVLDGKGIDSVSVETLEPGSDATVKMYDLTPGSVALKFGIPKGEKGDPGGGSGSDSSQNPEVSVSGIYAGAEEPTDGSLIWIDTTGDSKPLELDNSKWTDGYVSAGGGAIAGNANGEMYNTDFLPVNPGEVYTFYNTNSAWTSTWLAVNFYSHDLDTSGYVSRVTGSGAYLNFTVPDGVNYIILTSRALSIDDAYLTAAIVRGTEIPGSGGSDGEETPDETEKTLTSISAMYTGGDVSVGSAVTALTGIEVTAHYSDGTSETVTGYTLSGQISEGANTITVTYGGMAATFTVTGVADESEDDSDTSLWTTGYVDIDGTIRTGVNNNEMYYNKFIPVTPGDTWTLYNTASGWDSGVVLIGFYSEESVSSFVSRTSHSHTGGKNIVADGVSIYPFTVPVGAAYMLISARNMVGYTETAVIYEGVPEFELTQETVVWKNGYLNANGTLNGYGDTALTNGEMNSTYISVDAGATYIFGNSNADWTTEWVGICFFSDLAGTTVSSRVLTNTFTVPDGAKYVRLSSRNMVNYYITATLKKVS